MSSSSPPPDADTGFGTRFDAGFDPGLVDDLLDTVRRRPARLGTTRVLGIDGPSGSGKTTLADLLADAAGAPVVRLDELYRGWDGLDEVGPLVEELLAPLRDGGTGRVARWDWHRDRLGDDLVVVPAPLIVLEGVGSGQRRLAPLLSLLVWVEAPVEERHRRGLERDGEAAAVPLARWWQAEECHFEQEATRSRADRIITTASS